MARAPGEDFRFRLAVAKAYSVRRAAPEEKRARGKDCFRLLRELCEARQRLLDAEREAQRVGGD